MTDKKITDYLTPDEILAQMAEEAAELAQAALKLRRALDGTNLTPKSVDECKAAPVLEYCVCSAVVRSFFKGGYTEVRLVGKSPGGYMTPYSYPLAEIGEKLFYTPGEAAAYARQRTEQYEHNWASLDAAPMRRTWEKYLNGKEGTDP